MAGLRHELKTLHYSVELNRHEQQHTLLPTSWLAQRPLQLPPFEVCLRLAVLYFDNMEHCFRILHWPEFKDQLRIFFIEGENACRYAFAPQLVGVLALAVLLDTHRECETAKAFPTIRPKEAMLFMKSFLQSQCEKLRYCLPALQVKMLLLVSEWLNLTPMGDLLRLSGELLRDALVLKMDRDPATLPGMSVFEAELRRRYWMTIVEFDLMLSILCKMPATVPVYTSKPPQNVNDGELFAGMETLPESRPTMEWTDGLCQYLLAQSFPYRLAACKELGTSSNVTADEVLPSTRYLERVLQELPPPLRFDYLGDEASKSPARLMARMELDISIRRPLVHLYSRCVLSTDAEGNRRELRAGLLQSCLMIAHYQDLFDPRYSELDVPRPQGYWDFFYTSYRLELGQAVIGLCVEISKGGFSAPEDEVSSTNALSSSTTPSQIVMKTPSYTQLSLIDPVKDTLEPMTRRLPGRGAKVQDIVYYNVILTSLLAKVSGLHKEGKFQERLYELAQECRAELERANIPVIPAPGSEAASRPVESSMSVYVPNFDPLWDDFPQLDIFDRFEFDTAAVPGL